MKNVITIDCAGFQTSQDLHAAFAEALAFPAYYGQNLDALYDCLTEIALETELRLQNWDAAEAALGGKFRCVILDAAAENPVLSVIFG